MQQLEVKPFWFLSEGFPEFPRVRSSPPCITQPFLPQILPQVVLSVDEASPKMIPSTQVLWNIILNLERTEIHTCSDVKAMSLGTAAIPFSLTSGNILKHAISMAYMLDMAPPKSTAMQLPFLVTVNTDSHATTLISTDLQSSLVAGDRLIGYPLN